MSRKLTKLLAAVETGALAEYLQGQVQDIRGFAGVLELLYEHLGQKGDKAGQLILDASLDLLERHNFFKENIDSIPKVASPCVLPRTSDHKASSKEDDTPALGPKKKKHKAKKCIKSDSNSSKSDDEDKKVEKASHQKREQPKQISRDDEFANLEFEVVDAIDLKEVPIRYQIENNYLRLSDINPEFEYIYMSTYDEEGVQKILAAFKNQEYLGLDSEFHLRDAKCTYIQIATEKFGVIFNIQNSKFRFDPNFKGYLKQLMETESIKKVGHSISQDAKVIKRAFFGEVNISQLHSLEDMMFTCRTSILSLSNMCYRVFGKSLNKEFQSWIGERKEMDEDDQKEYAIMDALAPVAIFSRLKHFCLTPVKKGTFMVNCDQRAQVDLSDILLDHHMDQTRLFLDRFNLKSTVLTEKTYSGKFL